MKHTKLISILAAALMLTACTDNTPPESDTESTAPIVEPVESSVPDSTTAFSDPQTNQPAETAPGGVSLGNSYNELQSICTPINENDVYAEFEGSGLEYYSCAIPDFSEYYSFPDKIPEQVLYDMEHGAYPEMTPSQYYVRTQLPTIFDNCTMYCMVRASDESYENLIYDLWEVPVATGEPSKLLRIGSFPVRFNNVDYSSDYIVSLAGLNDKYIVYGTYYKTDDEYRAYLYNRSTGETSELALPENTISTFLLNDMLFIYSNYTVTVLNSEYYLPIIYKYNIPSGSMNVYKFNADLRSSSNSSLLVFDSDGQTFVENAWFGGWGFTPEENERYYYNSGSSVGVIIPTDESEVFGYKYLLGRQLNNDERQLFVKTSYKVYACSVSFSEGHYMGFILARYNILESSHFPLLYDKRGGQLMLVDPAEGLNNVCSDGRWMYYYGYEKIVAVLCE
ncbi:MAG: hypothetical protein ACI4KM_10400 [Oscillospiraceae bacterium]